jgi:hypothetical protein
MAKDLNLTDEQKNQVLGLFSNKDLKGKERDAALKKIIGDEKFDQYQKMREDRMNKIKNSGAESKKWNKEDATGSGQ